MNRAIWQESIFFGDNVRLLFLKTLKKAWRDLRHTGLAGSYLLPDEQSPSPRGGDALAWVLLYVAAFSIGMAPCVDSDR